MLLKIHCNFEKEEAVISMFEGPDVKLYELLQKISARRMEALRPDMYKFCAYNSANKHRNVSIEVT